MPTSYSNNSIGNEYREPLTNRLRSYYRSPRKSFQENLISNKIYIDLQRIYLELEATDTSMLNSIKIILDKEKDSTFTTEKSDGSRSFSLDSELINSMSFMTKWKQDSQFVEISEMETIDTIAARLSKISSKINRLEKNR
jgi:hypothetical protein